jgi:hypothetical protein
MDYLPYCSESTEDYFYFYFFSLLTCYSKRGELLGGGIEWERQNPESYKR